MSAKPNICVLLQCRQITFKGEVAKYFKQDLYYYHYYYFNYYYYSIIIHAVATDKIRENEISDDEISETFGGCAKKFFKSGTFVSIFQRSSGYYFTDARKCINRMKVYTIPSWMPKPKEPNIPFNLPPPSYQEITRIIKRMKSSGSTMPIRPDINNLLQVMTILKIIHVRYLH